MTLTSTHTVATDSAGNISDDGQAGYDYTLRNHLESRTLGVETSSYTFSADGRRVGMTRGATSMDVILGLGGRRLSRVLDGATRDYVWLGDTLIGYFDGTATEPVRVITSHIGFPLMAVDAAGTTVWEPLHEPYGELIGTFSKSADPGLRYPGQWQDEVDIEGSCVGDDCAMPGPLGGSVSLFENGFRWYRAGWGRYSQSDPIGRFGDLHLFVYAQNSPLRLLDEDGLKALCVECDARDKGVMADRLRQVAALQSGLISGETVPEGPRYPTGSTSCLPTLSGSGRPWTEYLNTGMGKCADACTRAHEQVHRDRCRLPDVYGRLDREAHWFEDGLAYLAEYECVKEALFRGRVQVEVDDYDVSNYELDQ